MIKSTGLSCVAAIALAMVAAPRPAAADRPAIFPDTIALPDGFGPEGLAVGPGATIFTGSIATGAIYQASLVTGKGTVLVPPQPGRAAIGLEFDPRTNLLYVAGGSTGAAFVYDARTGATVATFQLTTATQTFVNDQILLGDAVFFTDSQRPVLYRIPLGRSGRPSPTAAVTEIPLGGDFTEVPGAFNANGIVTTPDGRALIVLSSALGTLFRVDPTTGDARAIDLGGVTLTAGDGVLRRGDDLFVVQNQLDQIARVELDRRATHGEVVQVFSDARFDIPTAVDSFLGVLYTVNARFNTPTTADTTYTIEKVKR
jgi:sugar lactone lactonase YvrE